MNRKLNAIPFELVNIIDNFWTERLISIRENTLPHLWKTFEEDGRFRNFDKAAGKMDGTHEGAFFNDGLFFTALEGACHIYKLNPSPELAAMIDEAVRKIAAMQQPDGYVNSYFILMAPENRWDDILHGHELYTAGMLFEAAVVHYQTFKKRDLLDVAIRFADHIDTIFGTTKRPIYSGHPGIELGLLQLYSVTNEIRYLELVRFFVEMRGTNEAKEQMYSGWSAPYRAMKKISELPFGQYGRDTYMQAHVPVKEQSTIEGHAVRATYLYAGITELERITEDEEYGQALQQLWSNMVRKRMYITGGIGDDIRGWEGFSKDYLLPNDQAYCETCAAIGLVFWSHRMNMLYADAHYADILERVLFNSLLAGVSLDGKKFFYTNPLESDGSHRRQGTFGCACCPPNILRFFPQLGGYIYGVKEKELYVNLYIGGCSVAVMNGTQVALNQHSELPWEGKVHLLIDPAEPVTFDLYMRIPEWNENFEIYVNGIVKVDLPKQRGYVCISREWQAGDVVEVVFQMNIKQIESHPNVTANRGKLALERGPLVYCVEAPDNAGEVYNLSINRGAELQVEYRSELLGGVNVITGNGMTYNNKELEKIKNSWESKLYKEAKKLESELIQITAIPYFAWANREPGSMTVWINEHPQLAPIRDVTEG